MDWRSSLQDRWVGNVCYRICRVKISSFRKNGIFNCKEHRITKQMNKRCSSFVVNELMRRPLWTIVRADGLNGWIDIDLCSWSRWWFAGCCWRGDGMGMDVTYGRGERANFTNLISESLFGTRPSWTGKQTKKDDVGNRLENLYTRRTRAGKTVCLVGMEWN